MLRLLEPLAHFCLTRHEGYWSYEFCYKRGIRQFHNVAVRDPKGAFSFRKQRGVGMEDAPSIDRPSRTNTQINQPNPTPRPNQTKHITGRVTSKVESEYVIGREHPSYGEDFKEEHYIVQGEVGSWAWLDQVHGDCDRPAAIDNLPATTTDIKPLNTLKPTDTNKQNRATPTPRTSLWSTRAGRSAT